MRTTALVLAALVMGTAFLAIAPAADARQACVYGDSDPCDNYLVCVWDRINGRWLCEVYISDCWFQCWIP